MTTRQRLDALHDCERRESGCNGNTAPPLDARTRLVATLIGQVRLDLSERQTRDQTLLTVLEITEELVRQSEELAASVKGLTAVKQALEKRLAEELDRRSTLSPEYVAVLERQNDKLTAELRRRGVSVDEVLHGPTKIVNTTSREFVEERFLEPDLAAEAKAARAILEDR
jgi:hypothetical protein